MLYLVFVCTSALVLINSMGSFLGDNNINIKLAHRAAKEISKQKNTKAQIPLISKTIVKDDFAQWQYKCKVRTDVLFARSTTYTLHFPERNLLSRLENVIKIRQTQHNKL